MYKRGFSAPIEDKINKLFYEFNKSIEEKKEQIKLEQIKILIELKNEKKEKNYLEIIKKNFEKIINLFDFRIKEDYNSNLEYIKNLQKIMEEDYQTNFKTKIKKFKKDQFISNQKEFIHENLKEKNDPLNLEENINNFTEFCLKPLVEDYKIYSYYSLYIKYISEFIEESFKNFNDNYNNKGMNSIIRLKL